MSRNLKDYLIISLKGIAMGAADTVPGVSGGTIAFISGIYEELINSIGKIDYTLIKLWKEEGFKAVWKRINGNFLASLLLGIGLSIFTLMRLTKFLLETQPIPLWAFFFGLVLASIWFLGKEIKHWNWKVIFALILGAGVAFWITTFSAVDASNHSTYFLFFAGAIAVCAMILPGISGAYILLLLGAYREVTQAVSDFDFKKLAFLGTGIIVGLLSFAKILKWLFSKFETLTLAVLTGFIAGSLNKIWPWKIPLDTKTVDGKVQILAEQSVTPSHFGELMGDPKLLQAIIAFLIGFILILLLENLAHKKPK